MKAASEASPYARLARLGLAVPEASPPKGAYVPAVRSGDLVCVAGQIPMTDGAPAARGVVGGDITEEQAKVLSRQCALAALGAVETVVPLDRVTRVVKVVGYVASADGYVGQSAVVDGASELLADVFGAAGRHVRSVVGVSRLPFDVPMEIEVTFAVSA